MKAKEIQDLISFIAQSGLDEVNIETEQFKLSVKKNVQPVVVSAAPVQAAPVASAAPAAASAPAAPATPATPSPAAAASEKPAASNHITVRSPMIGTFYRSTSPDSAPFVNVGDEIKPGQALCIVEAMKLFNEIESEVSGRIVKVLVENATPVEYDQPLFLVEPI
ncbi:acetyl-CoA carboxylase biotin carboxyl carrier protein [Catalinimonas alkaloidigena]|uniref:Biotin carboxyl carrier protein of acetyl-CoA carboxylase n=1 Tax=Catalinimonas alkaloidigena TaxID=1075417 RepID=A0A1G8WFF7_9BACT|nr:acetyl-CoA carboxylase biotin carboxyl carrier protein [Catalinimonas alkaloidigena]SDJ76817.1 acetyl-CoA carboxylase biotin carboxyl carrier protein [Catalinimonas alkaloidigena]